MKLELNCVVSIRPKSEEKLPLDNILLLLLFEIARSYDLLNMTALSGENPKRRNTEHQGTEGPTHRRVKTPKSHDTSYPSLRRNIISYCCLVMSYWYIISLWYIIKYWYILSWYHILSLQWYTILASNPIILISCHADILCGIVSYDTNISTADTISYVYIEGTAIICVTKINTM